MTALAMKKPFATRLDEKILKALSEAADNRGLTIAKYLERLLIHDLTQAGTLPDNFKPEKSNWGGKREKKATDALSPIDADPLEDGRSGKRSGTGRKPKSLRS